MPAGMAGRIRDRTLRSWLSKGQLQYARPSREILHAVLDIIGHSTGTDGLAALRFWGQTSERCGSWIVAADPVHLEARLDHLCLHALRGAQSDIADVGAIFDYLQTIFGSDDFAFATLGQHAYLRSDSEIASAEISSWVISGSPPDEFMPQGPAAYAHHRLVSEVQMALHDHEINASRERRGLGAVNSIWLWGGGHAPEVSVEPILPLFANDPLFRGFWLSRTGLAEPWTDDFDACVALAEKGFVAVTPDGRDQVHQENGDSESPDDYLRALRRLQKRNKLGHLTLLFRDGLRADIRSSDRFRLWRGESSLLAPP